MSIRFQLVHVSSDVVYLPKGAKEEKRMNTAINSWMCTIDLVETGKNIRRHRIRRGLSVAEVAEFFGGIARNSVYKWERGETLPSIDHLYALTWLFRVSLDELIVGNRESLDCTDDQLVEFNPNTGKHANCMFALFCCNLLRR